MSLCFRLWILTYNWGVYEPGSVMNYLYKGVVQGWYPPLIFLGIGAMTDFSSLISNPKLMLLGGSSTAGIFLTFLGALYLGFAPPEAVQLASLVVLMGQLPSSFHQNWPMGSMSCQMGNSQKPYWPNSHCSLFLYGPGACDTATCHQTPHHQKREENQDEAT